MRYVAEIRSTAPDWRARFLRDLHWPLADGVIHHQLGKYRDDIGLYELLDLGAIELPATEPCRFIGPPRGLLAWAILDRPDDARAFGVSVGRAARGPILDRTTQTILPTVARIPTLVDTSRLHFLPDVHAVFKHADDLLLSDDPTYLDHVRQALSSLPTDRGLQDVPLWRYTSSMLGGSSHWFD